MHADAAVRTCAVVGSPIAHSLSPVLHRAAYGHLGLAWEYTRVELREGELAGFVAGLDGSWRGLSVTMPLKREALKLGRSMSPTAMLTGAANTLLFDPAGAVYAYNTDVNGMADSLRAARAGPVASACVLGAGSTAASALVTLASMEVPDVHLHARKKSRAHPTLEAADRAGLDIAVRPWAVGTECAAADLVVSTVPAGAADELAGALAAQAGPERVLFDVVYNPWPTVLADSWARTGGVVVSGLDLLVHQALGQVQLMTGQDVPSAVLYAALP
jgi:shikimate dehydrogenase